MSVITKVEAWCLDHGESLASLESKAGIANGVLGKWRKKETGPSLATLSKIADFTGVPIVDWLKEEE